jgi:hypothetical protein
MKHLKIIRPWQAGRVTVRGRIFVWIFWNGGEMDIFRKYAGGNLEKFRKDMGNDPGNSGRKRGKNSLISGILMFLGPKWPYSRTKKTQIRNFSEISSGGSGTLPK